MADNKPEMEMKVEDLYLEEVYTDLRMGTIRKLTPVKADGSRDETREIIYSGQARVMTPAGALPISFELDAKNIGEAAEAFGAAAAQGIEDTMKELDQMRRDAASGIVLPGAGDVSKVAGGQGGAGSGGLIQP